MRNYSWLGLCCAALLIPPMLADKPDKAPVRAAVFESTQTPILIKSEYLPVPDNLPGQPIVSSGFDAAQPGYHPSRSGQAAYSGTSHAQARDNPQTYAFRQHQPEPQLSAPSWDQRQPDRPENTNTYRNRERSAREQPNPATSGYVNGYGYTAPRQQDRNRWSSQAYPNTQIPAQGSGYATDYGAAYGTAYSNPTGYDSYSGLSDPVRSYSSYDPAWNGFTP